MWSALTSIAPPPLAELNGTKVSDSAKKKAPSHVEYSPEVTAPATTSIVSVVQKTKSGVEPSTHEVDVGCSGDTRAGWNAFLQQRLETEFYRGAALLSGFPSAQHKPYVRTKNNQTRQVVDTELWNSYWFAFSDRFAAQIDDVQEYLSKHGGETDERRRVLVAASLLLESDMDSFRDKLADHAHSFGALEHVTRERCVVMLQFTSSRSAEVFAAWASSLNLVDLLGDFNTAKQGNAHCRLLVRFASHDNSKLTSTLILGENILLSTPFVEGLFKGIFDAVGITYQAGFFLITFGSVQAAKVALHSLQRSLIVVFGLTLTFSAQREEHVVP